MIDLHFRNPPLIELVLGLQCEDLDQLTLPHVGLLWQLFRKDFPETEVHSPLDPAFEKFGSERSGTPRPSIQVFQTPPFPRFWFLNANGTEVIQVQQDRFMHNWRKQEGDEYPHYDVVREKFRSELDLFSRFLAEENLGEVVPNQCEITYVNHILPGNLWQDHSQYDRIINVDFGEALKPIGSLEGFRFRTTHLIRSSEEVPVGRLYISFRPAFIGAKGIPMFSLTFTARGIPDDSSIEGVLRFLDLAHDMIVESFVKITTPMAQEEWGG